MDNTKYVALSRQMGLWKQMDIVSNNMANMNTSGYKQDEAVFSSYIVKTQNAAVLARFRFSLLRITAFLRIFRKVFFRKREISWMLPFREKAFLP